LPLASGAQVVASRYEQVSKWMRTALVPGCCVFQVVAQYSSPAAAMASQRAGAKLDSHPDMVPPIRMTGEPSFVLHRALPQARTPKVLVFEVDVEAVVELDVDVLGHAGVALGSGLVEAVQVVPVQENHWQELFSW